MRRSVWTVNVLDAWQGEPCPGCGRKMRSYDVDDQGEVWSFCDYCWKEYWVAWEPIPSHFDPEPAEDDLPF